MDTEQHARGLASVQRIHRTAQRLEAANLGCSVHRGITEAQLGVGCSIGTCTLTGAGKHNVLTTKQRALLVPVLAPARFGIRHVTTAAVRRIHGMASLSFSKRSCRVFDALLGAPSVGQKCSSACATSMSSPAPSELILHHNILEASTEHHRRILVFIVLTILLTILHPPWLRTSRGGSEPGGAVASALQGG